MIIFLYGPDSFRAKRKLGELKDKFRREIDIAGNDLVAVDGEKATLNQINELVSPASLFSKKRMAVIENVFSNKSAGLFAELLKFLKKNEKGENIIIFLDPASSKEKLAGEKNELFKFLAAQKYSQEFKELSREDLARWIKKEISDLGASITPKALDLLMALAENSWQLNSELGKIAAYKAAITPAGEKAQIEESDVHEMVKGKLDTNIFALTDSIGAKNKALALKLLEDQFQSGANDSYLLSMILRQFKIILGIRQALDSGGNSRNIASILKLHPFIVQKGMSQARFFKVENLKTIVSKLVEIDFDLKTGKGDLKTNLNLLIAGLK
ncbi:MAG: DNA polymerase III subunit delta [Patescibacteria group bacterium]|jgi:DNA polymerase-3 subunit delta